MTRKNCYACKFYVDIPGEPDLFPSPKCALSNQSVQKFEGDECKFFKEK